jgi:hypothetical protein
MVEVEDVNAMLSYLFCALQCNNVERFVWKNELVFISDH